MRNEEEASEAEPPSEKQCKKRKSSKKVEKWGSFRVLQDGRAILRGSSSTVDRRFKPLSRGRQASAAAAVAVVYAHLFESRDWQPESVDRVLEYGDRLYRVSRARAKLDDDVYVSTCLLQQEFFVGDYKCRICTEPAAVYGNIASEAVGAPSLEQGLRKFLQERNYGVFTSQGVSMAIWQQPPDGCFYFDGAPVDENGKKCPQGSACLLRSKDVDGILETIMSNLNCQFDSRYCIDRVSVVSVKLVVRPQQQCRLGSTDANADDKVPKSVEPIDSEESSKRDCTKAPPASSKLGEMKSGDRELVQKIPLKIEMTNLACEARFSADRPLIDQHLQDERYTYDDVRANVPSTLRELANGSAILHGWTHEASDAYKAKGAQAVANCVMALGVKKVNPVRTWLRTTLDEILAMGDALYADVKVAKPSIKTATAADFNETLFKIDGRKLVAVVDLLTVIGTIVSKIPSVLNLKQGFDEFFLNNTDGILETPSLSVAFWSENDHYYLFDSKSCDINGQRVNELEQGKQDKDGAPSEKKIMGKCCVIRFPSLTCLTNHVLKQLDPTRSNDRFIIRRMDIMDDVPGTRVWNSFKPGVAGKSWILRGSINSDYEYFNDRSRGVQGLAMPVVAIISASTIVPPDWSAEDVDEALREGDAYYNLCIPPSTESDEEEKSLVVKTLKKYLYYKKCKVTIEVRESTVTGDLQSLDDDDSPNLEQAVRAFFGTRQFGVVEFENKYLAMWKFEQELQDKSKETSYYLFHDKPSESFFKNVESGNDKSDTSACVVRFLDPSELARVLNDEFHSDDGEERANSDFYIHEINLASMSEPMSDEDIQRDKATPVKPDLRAYTTLGDGGAYLAGSFSQANETLFKRETLDKQQAANALVALATTKIFDPFLWYPEVLDDILRMGDKLSEENAENIGANNEEGDLSRNFLLPGEINRDFRLGVNQIAVDVEDDSAMGKLEDLARTLDDFFNSSKMGIFRQDKIMLPLWRIDNTYFTMDPRGTQNGSATVYWFIDLQSLVDFMTEILDPNGGDFSIDKVSVENTIAESERTPSEDMITDDQWYNFAKVSEGVWKIDCGISLSDEIFEEANCNNQSTAISVMAIIFSKVYEAQHWSAEVLDEVTITGDKLHTQSAERLGKQELLHPKEIIKEFFVADRRINLDVLDCVQAGTLVAQSHRVQDIEEGIERFFKKFHSGSLTLLNIMTLAIWTYEEHFYCMIPGNSLMRFQHIGLLTEQLKVLGTAETEYEISSVDVIDWNKFPPWKYDPSPAVKPSNLPPLNAYMRLPGMARAILRSSTHEASEIFPESVRGRQTAANCVISLAMATIKNPITWTRKTLDEILAIGTDLYRESLESKTDITSLKPKDIVRIFNIGVNILAIDVEESTVTGIVANPPPEPESTDKNGKKRKSDAGMKDKKKGKQGNNTKRTPPPTSPPILLEEGLNKFFENNNAGILVTGRFMVAIWKDSGVYFMYDPRSRNRKGLRDDYDTEGTSCVVWFACREPLFTLISTNINDDEKYAKFKICRVVIKTVPIESLPAPTGYKAISDDSCNGSGTETEEARGRNLSDRMMDIDLETSFTRIDEEMSILLGTTHISACRFVKENRGFQSSATACVAIVVASLHAPSTWTPILIDAILKNLMAGITLEHDLLSTLSFFFANNSAGILHTANFAIPVMMHWEKFYFLDPSDKNKLKKDSFEGAACLIKCENVKKLAKVIIQICAFKEPIVYTLTAVKIVDLHFFWR